MQSMFMSAACLLFGLGAAQLWQHQIWGWAILAAGMVLLILADVRGRRWR